MDKLIAKSLKSYYGYLKNYGYLNDNEVFKILTFVQILKVVDLFSDDSDEKRTFEKLLKKLNDTSRLYDFYNVPCCKSKYY